MPMNTSEGTMSARPMQLVKTRPRTFFCTHLSEILAPIMAPMNDAPARQMTAVGPAKFIASLGSIPKLPDMTLATSSGSQFFVAHPGMLSVVNTNSTAQNAMLLSTREMLFITLGWFGSFSLFALFSRPGSLTSAMRTNEYIIPMRPHARNTVCQLLICSEKIEPKPPATCPR